MLHRSGMWASALLCTALTVGTPMPAAAQDGDEAPASSAAPIGGISASVSGEARLRYEGYVDPAWGDAPSDGYLWIRVIPLAKVEAGTAQVVVQPIIGYAVGVAGGPGPVDRTGIDLMQGYGDLSLPLDEDTRISVRAGRTLLALGSQRLVGMRYGPNIPQPFDGVKASAQHAAARIDVIDMKAVAIGPGNFDDTSGRKRIRSVYLTAEADREINFDLYWIGFDDEAAHQIGVSGAEARDTFGVRLFGQGGRVSWNWETMIQRGQFAGRSIRAWSQATETTFSLSEAPLAPQLRFRANIASGDRSGTDDTLESFNAMFPKGRYFGELTPLGPRNIININPGIVLNPAPNMQVELNVAAFWRASLSDGVYDLAGREIRGAGKIRARHIGNLVEASLALDLASGLSLAASLGAFSGGPFMRQSGKADTILMLGAEATYRF